MERMGVRGRGGGREVMGVRGRGGGRDGWR